MKLLITTQAVNKNDPILGFFHRWIEEFAKHFEEIHVICLYEGEHTLPPNVHVYSLGKESGENRLKYVWRFYTFFTKIFFREKVDFVFFHMGAIYNLLALPFFLVRRLTKTKFFWWKTHGKLDVFGRMASRCVDSIVTAGSKSFNMTSDKVKVVGHAIDTDFFNLRVRQNSPQFNILGVGRIVPIKKYEIAIGAIAKFRNNFWRETTLHLYGPESDSKYKEKLKDLISDLGVRDSVLFCGSINQTELLTVYNECDVLIHPAYEAGFDKVVLEAMATGAIPVTSIESFHPVLSQYGLYIDAGDVDGYVSVLKRIHELSQQERILLQNNLRDEVCKNHSISTLPKRIFSVV